MKHSLICAYRNRHEILKVCLDAYLHCEGLDQIEFLLVDLNSQDDTQKVLEQFAHKLNLKHHLIPYDGNFLRSKALNYGLKHAQGTICTVIDIDIIPQPHFLKLIHEFYERPNNRNTKTSRNVMLVDPHHSGLVKCHQTYEQYSKWLFGYDATKSGIKGYQNFATFPNTGWWDAVDNPGPPRIVGNSQSTMTKENFLKVGGYNELFKAYGFEDWDMGYRCHRRFGDTVLLDWVYHMHHPPQSDRWQNPDLTKTTRDVFNAAWAAGLPDPLIDENWGNFDKEFNT